MFIENLKKNLQGKLDEHNMNVNELEKQAGIRSNKVRKILLGYSHNPTVETLLAVSNVFCCSVDELLGNNIKDEEFYLSGEAIWDKNLLRTVFKETFDYICDKDVTPSVKKIIYCIMEVYNYCLSKNKGEFDKQFFEWHVEKQFK